MPSSFLPTPTPDNYFPTTPTPFSLTHIHRVLDPQISELSLSKCSFCGWVGCAHTSLLCTYAALFHPVVCPWTPRQVMSLGYFEQCCSKPSCEETCLLYFGSFWCIWVCAIAGSQNSDIFTSWSHLHNIFPLWLVTKTKRKRNFSLAEKCSGFNFECTHWWGLS